MHLDSLLEHLKKNRLLQPTKASPYDPPKLNNPVWSGEFERVHIDVASLFQPVDENNKDEHLLEQVENILSDNEEDYADQELLDCELLDAAAWYCPFHFFEEDYGIYIREDAVYKYARSLWFSLKKKERTEVWNQPWPVRSLFQTSLFRLLPLGCFFMNYTTTE